MSNEVWLLTIAARMANEGPQSWNDRRFHGYELVRRMQDEAAAQGMRALNHATVYRALRHLEEVGALTGEWEQPTDAQQSGRENRPRRYYRLTHTGLEAVTAAANRPQAGSLRQLAAGPSLPD